MDVSSPGNAIKLDSLRFLKKANEAAWSTAKVVTDKLSPTACYCAKIGSQDRQNKSNMQ